MHRIFYSKSPAARSEFVRSAFADSRAKKLAYLVPKKFMSDVAQRLPEAELHAYEDVVKKNDLFNLADSETMLVFDRPSRYKLITSNMFVRLSRISARYEHKCMVDIVPFTASVEYLYTPLALMDRDILGYQHFYSFRENNWEEQPDGSTRRAHDFDFLAQKISRVATIDYHDFLGQQVEVIDCPLTQEEAAEYQKLRDRLFEENDKANPIITKLADWTNIRESRYAVLSQLLEEGGTKVIYTNLSGHNKRIKKRFKHVDVRSFYDTNGGEDQYDTVILFETPIVRGYLFLDVIANVRSDCRIYIFKSDTTVDRFLFKKMFEEYDSINNFCKSFYKEVHT